MRDDDMLMVDADACDKTHVTTVKKVLPRDPERVHRIIGKLEALWNTVPDQRFFQLVVNLARFYPAEDVFYVEDARVEQLISDLMKCNSEND